jgi:hypothetical protein
MTLQRYLANRRYWEVALWSVFLSIGVLSNIGVVWMDQGRIGSDVQAWEPVVWETTSHIALGMLIPLILWFDRLFPIGVETWRRSMLAHSLFTIVFSLLHVTLMYWARVAAYVALGDNSGYGWRGWQWWVQFGYEYLKDFRAYFMFLAIIYLYRFVLRRLQGEAEFLSEGREEAEPVAVTDRFLIKKLGREFLVRVQDIDWIQSSGNYVNLCVGTRVYPLRETMAGISDRLAKQGFQRVHRSAIVNLDRVVEIVPFETGEGEARLASDVRVPVSRRYRKELRDKLG